MIDKIGTPRIAGLGDVDIDASTNRLAFSRRVKLVVPGSSPDLTDRTCHSLVPNPLPVQYRPPPAPGPACAEPSTCPTRASDSGVTRTNRRVTMSIGETASLLEEELGQVSSLRPSHYAQSRGE